MAYRRTLKYVLQRVEGIWNDDGDLIGEEVMPAEPIYYPWDLNARAEQADGADARERTDETSRRSRTSTRRP